MRFEVVVCRSKLVCVECVWFCVPGILCLVFGLKSQRDDGGSRWGPQQDYGGTTVGTRVDHGGIMV